MRWIIETRRSSWYSLDFLPVHAKLLDKFVWFTDLAEKFRMFGVFNRWVLWATRRMLGCVGRLVKALDLE